MAEAEYTYDGAAAARESRERMGGCGIWCYADACPVCPKCGADYRPSYWDAKAAWLAKWEQQDPSWLAVQAPTPGLRKTKGPGSA